MLGLSPESIQYTCSLTSMGEPLGALCPCGRAFVRLGLLKKDLGCLKENSWLKRVGFLKGIGLLGGWDGLLENRLILKNYLLPCPPSAISSP